MQEKEIQFENTNLVDLFGANNAHINLIKKFYPDSKIIARGNSLKIIAEANEIASIESVIQNLQKHFKTYHRLNEGDVSAYLHENRNGNLAEISDDNQVLVFGSHGNQIKARTPNQKKMVKLIEQNDLLFAIGPAGTGKTYTAVALAVRALKNKEVKRIVLTRPAVEAGENLGFLPGDLKDKLDPYLQPLFDALRDMIPHEKLNFFMETGVIQIAPLAYMRGRTLDNAFVILDEAQNTTESQLKMFLTRMGQTAKFIVTGDIGQVDLPKNQPSGLRQVNDYLQNIKGIAFVYLDEKDILRHKLVKKILSAYEKFDLK